MYIFIYIYILFLFKLETFIVETLIEALIFCISVGRTRTHTKFMIISAIINIFHNRRILSNVNCFNSFLTKATQNLPPSVDALFQ